MFQWELDWCPEWVSCEESKLGVDFDDYFDCGEYNSCNDLDEWGYIDKSGDFCSHYSGIDDYFLEYCDDTDSMYANGYDYCPNWLV
jgi:hypothetical protein